MAQKLDSALVTWLFFLILPFTLAHEALEQRRDSGRPLPLVFTGERGRTYKCIQTSINFRIQGHMITLIEVGVHMQEVCESLDVHVLGQSVTVSVTFHAHQPTKDFFIAASSHFTKPVLTATAILHCFGSKIPPSKPLPSAIGPICHVHWFIKRARTIRLNWIAKAARPNPQGSSHHGSIQIGPCTYKKSPTETEPFAAGTKSCSHAVQVLPRNRKLLGKLPDGNVRSPPLTSNEKSSNLDKKDPPSPPPPTGNQPIHH